MKNPFKKILIGLSLLMSLSACSGFLPKMRAPSRNRGSSEQISEVRSDNSAGPRSNNDPTSTSTAPSDLNPYNYHLETDGRLMSEVTPGLYTEERFFLASEYGDHLRLSDRSGVVSNNYQLHIENSWFLANRYGLAAAFYCDRVGTYSFTVTLYNSDGYGVSETFYIKCLSEEDTYHAACSDENFQTFTDSSCAALFRVENIVGNWAELDHNEPYTVLDISNLVIESVDFQGSCVWLYLRGEVVGEGYISLNLNTLNGLSFPITLNCTVRPHYDPNMSIDGDPYIANGEERLIEFTLYDPNGHGRVSLDPNMCYISDTNGTARIVEASSRKIVVGLTNDKREEFCYVNVVLVSYDGFDFHTGYSLPSEDRYFGYYYLCLDGVYGGSNLQFTMRFSVRNDANQTKTIMNFEYNGNYGNVGYNDFYDIYQNQFEVTITTAAQCHEAITFTAKTDDNVLYTNTWEFEFYY